jgi:hypothetical protein
MPSAFVESFSHVLADDDTDEVFGGEWGSSSVRELEEEREQYDKQRESVHFNVFLNGTFTLFDCD